MQTAFHLAWEEYLAGVIQVHHDYPPIINYGVAGSLILTAPIWLLLLLYRNWRYPVWKVDPLWQAEVHLIRYWMTELIWSLVILIPLLILACLQD